MKYDHLRPARRAAKRVVALLALAAAGVSSPAVAVEPPPATTQNELLDPWVPPSARQPAATAPTRGAALRAQVEAKLKARFDAAAPGGALTRGEAQAGGLGYIVRHFDEIDRQHAGAVRFEDVKRYLRERGAKLD